jgi:hypothetical protein
MQSHYHLRPQRYYRYEIAIPVRCSAEHSCISMAGTDVFASFVNVSPYLDRQVGEMRARQNGLLSGRTGCFLVHTDDTTIVGSIFR